MAPPLEFAPRRPRTPKRPPGRPAKRQLGDKLQILAERSPKDLDAIEVLADFILAHLDEHNHKLA